jgi:TolA-binding protein
MNIFKTLSLAIALVCASGAAAATDQPASAAQPVSASAAQAQDSVADILATQHGIRDHLDKRDGEYARYSDAAIGKMKRAQDRIFSMLSGVESLDQLNRGQRVDLSNALDEVKANLLAKDDSRMICHIERKIGSNMMQRHCETVAQRNANAEEARKEMMNHPEHYQQSGH